MGFSVRSKPQERNDVRCFLAISCQSYDEQTEVRYQTSPAYGKYAWSLAHPSLWADDHGLSIFGVRMSGGGSTRLHSDERQLVVFIPLFFCRQGLLGKWTISETQCLGTSCEQEVHEAHLQNKRA